MKWTKFSLHTTTAAEDLVSGMLADLGIEGVEIEDHVPITENETKGVFIDVLPDRGIDDGKAVVSFYLEDPSGWEDLKSRIMQGLDELSGFVDVGECSISISETEDKDWINNWKEFFRPFTVGDLLIRPTWEDTPAEDEGRILIQIDPGTAFGTGQHETTQLCLLALPEYVTPGCRVLDVGTGSGILGIAALKLGAGEAVGTDLDDNAICAVKDNREANNITDDEFKVILGNLIDDKNVQDFVGYECYDIAVANILANVIISLQEEIPRHLKHGGIFITSGIIDTREQDVFDAIDANPELEYIKTNRQGEWVSLIARRK